MVTHINLRSSTKQPNGNRFYFTYGSNMRLQQMAERCEESILHSKGILYGYKWQVNSRGGATIVKSSETDYVEGIVFLLTHRDVQCLRLYEKINEQYFFEQELDLVSERFIAPEVGGQTTARVVDILAKQNIQEDPALSLGSRHVRSNSERNTNLRIGANSLLKKVLVYLVQDGKESGIIRREYIARMKLAISDAAMLGVSSRYIETYLYPHLLG
ncbi:hypothetical protein GQ44DRAFT_633189 [Phaeosphaeriaceae sp. PMI808]|nr:hypothetical protein GQ44DRAFT_633189 [Phaeosphaeriaceae sp. PMI808]